MKTTPLMCALLFALASLASAQSNLTTIDGLVLHDPLRVLGVGTAVLVKGEEMDPGVARLLQRPELEGQQLEVYLERGRLVAIDGRTRGDITVLSSPSLGAKPLGKVKANSPLMIVDHKTVDGRAWVRVYRPQDKLVGAVGLDQVELVPPGAISSWLGRQLAPLFGKGTREKQARFFHPDGHVYAAEVIDLNPSTPALRKVADELAGQALIRLGGGLQRLAADGNENDGTDGLSMAIRFTGTEHPLDIQTRPGDQDLLLTAWAERFHHLATRTPFGDPHDFFNNHYFPGVPYKIGDQPVWLRLVPKQGIKRYVPAGGVVGRAVLSKLGFGNAERDGRNRIPHLEQKIAKDEARFVLQVQRGDWWRLRRPWIDLVEVRLTKPLPEVDQNALKYHPHLEGAGLKPVGFWTDVRRSVYRASQDERDKLGAAQRLQGAGE